MGIRNDDVESYLDRSFEREPTFGRRPRIALNERGTVRVRHCTIADHEQIKLDESRWSSLQSVGLQATGDSTPGDTHLELRNCSCGSTLARPAKSS